jgi:two-component system, NarL family, sensor histidine kinase UhpB
MTNQEKTGAILRVLLVEDCEDDALLLERELTKGGYKPLVKRLDSPSAMSAALHDQTWDLVLADWNLPRFSAIFALEMLKCSGFDLPFIIVSGTMDEEAAITAMKAGAHDYVMKSSLGRLVPVIQRELCEADDRRSRKRAEAALAASEERLKLVALATKDTIWDWDLTTQTLSWNEGLQVHFGFRPNEVHPGVESWYSCLHPEEKERVVATRYAEINGAGEKWSDQYRFCRADGTYAHVLDRGYVLRNEESRAVRAVGALIDLTEQKRAEVEIAAAYERLRDLTVRMEHTKEEERKRIARELHDEFAQMLTGLKLDLAALGKQVAKGVATSKPELIEKLQSMAALVGDSIHLVRKVASSLRPSILDDLGLVPALQWQAREFEARAGIPCETALSQNLSQRELDPDRSTALFRIAQELLTNVMRHAHASRVRLALREESDGLLLEVSDDGCGIAEREYVNPTTLGLRGLQERVALFGGTLHIVGDPEKGTSVWAWIPQGSEHAENRTTSAL